MRVDIIKHDSVEPLLVVRRPVLGRASDQRWKLQERGPLRNRQVGKRAHSYALAIGGRSQPRVGPLVGYVLGRLSFTRFRSRIDSNAQFCMAVAAAATTTSVTYKAISARPTPVLR